VRTYGGTALKKAKKATPTVDVLNGNEDSKREVAYGGINKARTPMIRL